MITLSCSKATKSAASSHIYNDRVKNFFVKRNIMWSFKVLTNIISMFSLDCNSTKNGNNNITMILTLDDIRINIKIFDFQFRVRQE